MPKTDDLLDPGLQWRLRAALDRVQPPHSSPRYQSVAAVGALRTAFLRSLPVVAVAVAGLLLTAYAATGSPNPVTWTQNAASAITNFTHAPEPSPTAEPSSAPVEQPVQRSGEPATDREKPESDSESISGASEDPHRPESPSSSHSSDGH